MEMLDVVNEQGEPTGEQVERKVAHSQGILHRTSHVWIARMRNNKPQILLQKRSANKDSHPGCYDISSAGHIPAGFGFEESAVRELHEELGIQVTEQQLIPCGFRRIRFSQEFHGKQFVDNQYSKIYLLWHDCEIKELRLQKEEIESAMWIDYEECCHNVENNAFSHCIWMEELNMLKTELYR